MLSRIREALGRRWRRWMLRHPRLAGLRQVLRGTFDWEHRACLYGQMRHAEDLERNSGDGVRYALRRGIHRLEKGLVARPRREVFGESYIEQTVEQLAGAAAGHGLRNGDALVSWSAGVLEAYFSAAGSTPRVERARRRYIELLAASPASAGGGGCAGATARGPIPTDAAPPPVTCEQFLELVRRRRSIRRYQRRCVPREVIDRALDAARWSPSACNRQPFQFRVFDDPVLARRVGGLPMGASDADQFPCVVVIVGQLRAFPLERDRHVIYIDAALAAMAFQFALQTQGVGSCPINWPEIPHLERRMARLLELEPDERPVMLISLGYPDESSLVPSSGKKSLDELRSYNQGRIE